MQLKQSYLAQHLEIYIFKTKDVCKYVTGSIALFLHTHTCTHMDTDIYKMFLHENFFFSINGFIGQHENLQKKNSIIHIKKYTAT